MKVQLGLFVVCAVCIVAVCLPVVCYADVAYSGELKGAGDFLGGGAWLYAGTSVFSWEISESRSANMWNYSYNLSVPRGSIQYIVIQLPQNQKSCKIQNITSGITYEIGTFAGGGGHGSEGGCGSSSGGGCGSATDSHDEGGCSGGGSGGSGSLLPLPMYGIRFSGFEGHLVEFSFDSPLMPAWTNMYSKGKGKFRGEGNELFNKSYISYNQPGSDAGSVTMGPGLVVSPAPVVIPEPVAPAMGGLGMLCIAAARRKMHWKR